MRLLREQDALLHTHCISRALFPFPPYVGDTQGIDANLTQTGMRPKPKACIFSCAKTRFGNREHVRNPDKPLENRGLETNA